MANQSHKISYPYVSNDDRFIVLTVVNVCPTIMGFQNKLIAVKNCKSIHDMSAKGGINIFRNIFSCAGSIPRPISKI